MQRLFQGIVVSKPFQLRCSHLSLSVVHIELVLECCLQQIFRSIFVFLAFCTTFLTRALGNRCDKLTREVREKEESLAKARVDLAAELQASGGASIVPVGAQTPPSGAAATAASLSVLESLGLGQQVSVRLVDRLQS